MNTSWEIYWDTAVAMFVGAGPFIVAGTVALILTRKWWQS